MSDSLPPDTRGRNVARSPSLARPFVVLFSRPAGADAARIVLRDTVEADPTRVCRLALSMLDGVQARHGRDVDVQVLDGDAVLLFAAGGAQR